MADEPTSQASNAPAGGFVSDPGSVATPQTVAPPTPVAPPEPQAPDYAALDEQVRALGDGYTMETVPNKVKDLQRGMSEAQREAADIRKRYEVAEPLLGHLDGTPGFAAYMQEKVNEFFQKDEYESNPAQAQPVTQAFDQRAWQIQKIEQQLASIEQNRQLDELEHRYPQAMTLETKQEILTRMNQQGGEASMHLFAIQGQAMMQQERQAGADATRSSVGYVSPQAAVSFAQPAPKAAPEMTEDEKEQRVQEILNQGG